MTDTQDIEKKFWKALKSDRTAMLSLDGVQGAQPMTVLTDQDKSPLWIFTSKETDLVRQLSPGQPGALTFASKGHELFASLLGRICEDNDRAVIDRLWNPFVAAWYKGGKEDPELALLRFDVEDAKIWADASSLLAGVKILLGADPKKDYKDKVAEVHL
ncbi:pyridoxamine 5'-phosphate oxidase family protein [Asticcacaulis solisilvae]|uniref:pyridoxamine 5'-phosphate oxidase family protein n=1 Tax=Asticcacaulis solisilvae TaxID=1217274 RepID=UPI003FD894D5